MSLRETKEELYRKKSDIERREHKQDEFNLESGFQKDTKSFQEEKVWGQAEKGLKKYQKKVVIIGLSVVLLIVASAAAVWIMNKVKQASFDEENVSVEIDGPNRADSVQLVRYIIRYKNDNRVDLNNVAIHLNYSENFQPEDNTNVEHINANNSKIYVGKVGSFSESEIEFKGRFYAPEDHAVVLRATLQYTPSNFNSIFKSEGNKSVNIKSSPILLEIDAPLEAADGNSIEYVIDYKNISTRYFSNLRLEIKYPEGFAFNSAAPSPSEGNNFWYIGSLEEGEKGKIVIQGNISGSKNEGKVIELNLGSIDDKGDFVSYGQRERLTRLVASPLIVYQTINKQVQTNVNQGEVLNVNVYFRNDGEIGLRNVIVTCKIDGEILDFSGIEIDSILRDNNSAYDSNTGLITWKAVDVPQLANLQPKQEGQASFTIPILGKIPIETKQDKNFTITSIAKVDSPDIPTPIGTNKVVASNRVDLKLNTEAFLEVTGYYNDANIENSGPMPPQVGKETSYAMHWLITNTFNDISNVKLKSSLPTGVKWLGKIFPENENINFNERTQEIIWDVGNIENGVGILSQKKEVSFQVGIVPESHNVGEQIKMLNEGTLTAKDMFTSHDITLSSVSKSTFLPEDSSIASVDGYNYNIIPAE